MLFSHYREPLFDEWEDMIRAGTPAVEGTAQMPGQAPAQQSGLSPAELEQLALERGPEVADLVRQGLLRLASPALVGGPIGAMAWEDPRGLARAVNPVFGAGDITLPQVYAQQSEPVPPAADTGVSREQQYAPYPDQGVPTLQVRTVANPDGTFAYGEFIDRQGRQTQITHPSQVGTLVAEGRLVEGDAAQLLSLPFIQSGPARGAGGPRGMAEVSMDQTIHGQVDPNLLAQGGVANDRAAAAQQAVDAGNISLTKTGADHQVQAADLLNQQAAQAQQEMQQHEQLIQQRALRLDEMMGQVAQQRIDPEGFFGGDGGFARRLGATLAVALGSLGSSLTGGPNQALGIINASIERNINAQESNLQHGRASVAAGQQALAQMQNLYQDMDAARAATRALHLQAAVNRLDAQMATLGPDQLARAQELRNALLEQQEIARQIAAQRSAVTARVRTTTRMPMGPEQQAQLQGGLMQAAAPRPAQQSAATAPAQSPWDSTLPPLSDGAQASARRFTQQAVTRERGRRRPAPQAAPSVPVAQETPPAVEQHEQFDPQNVYIPPRSTDEMNPAAMAAMLDRSGRTAVQAGLPTALFNLRPLDTPAARQQQQLARSTPESQALLRSLDRRAGRFLAAAAFFENERDRTSLLDPENMGAMEAALREIGAAMRDAQEMGTAGSVGEINYVERLVSSDADGITRLLGPTYDVQRRRLAGVMRNSLNSLERRANSDGYTGSWRGARAAQGDAR
jgi:hypothetical protein